MKDVVTNLDKIHKDLEKLSKPLSRLGDNLADGILLKNDEIFVARRPTVDSEWRVLLHQTGRGYSWLWKNGWDREKTSRVYKSRNEEALQRELEHLGKAAWHLYQSMPENLSNDDREKVESFLGTLAHLSFFDFFRNHPEPYEKFKEIGDAVLSTIEQLTKKIPFGEAPTAPKED